MSFPQPLQIDLPGGRTGYYNPYTGKYTTSRSYGLRMQRGFAAGQTQQAARGKPEREHIVRREREQERLVGPGITGDNFPLTFRMRYGFDYSYWQRLQRLYVREINRRASPGARIEPQSISDIIQLYRMGWRDPNRPDLANESWETWVEVHLAERLNAMQMYQEFNDARIGNYNFQSRSNIAPIEFWWYH